MRDLRERLIVHKRHARYALLAAGGLVYVPGAELGNMDEAYTRYLDYFRSGPYAPYVKECRLAGSAPVCLFHIGQPAGAFPDPPVPMFALQLIVGGKARIDFDMGAGRGSERLRAGQIYLAPPGTPTDYVLDDASEFLVVSVPAASVQSALSETSPGLTDFGRLHAAPFRDVFIEGLCQRVWEEGVEGGPLGTLFADYAVLVLAAALLRLTGRPLPVAPRSQAGLAPWRLRRVAEYVEENLGHDPSLTDLAQAAGLSPWHFARALRRATGTSPIRYLQRCRIERAKTLLADTDLATAQIALAVGFKNQDHFARVFRRLAGETPATYRQAMRL